MSTDDRKIAAAERLQWWDEARFGMFIHWGLYAVPAGTWKGEQIPSLGEWIMRNAKIPIEEYEQLAPQFNPVKFNATEWVGIAKRAGMKYLVITSKHHDGFCNFRSASNPYNIVDRTPFGRDPMAELAEACQAAGIRLCFYYSQAQDWHAPGGAGHWEEADPENPKNWHGYTRPAADFAQYLEDVVKPNLRELLTQYGPIGLIWFDTPVFISKEQSEELRDLVHELQPECLVSGRVGHDVGDYGSLGDNQHTAGKLEGCWETPCTLNDTWGYKSYDHNWKSVDFLLDLLVNCASKGVNYLLNVGPTGEGLIPQPSIELLEAVGDWLEVNGEAIYETKATPYPYDFAWGRMTCKEGALYLLVKQWPGSSLELRGVKNKVTGARLLAAPETAVPCTQDGDVLTLTLPADAPQSPIAVIAVDIVGTPEVEQLPLQQGDGAVSLPAYIGQVSGVETTVERDGSLSGWTSADGKLSWTFRVYEPGRFKVTVVTTGVLYAVKSYGTHEVQVSVGDSSVTGQAGVINMDTERSAEPWQFVKSGLGEVELPAGDLELTLQVTGLDPEAGKGFTPVAVELTSVG